MSLKTFILPSSDDCPNTDTALSVSLVEAVAAAQRQEWVGHVALMWREGYMQYWLGKLHIGVDGETTVR
jgi:hypothetical protein